MLPGTLLVSRLSSKPNGHPSLALLLSSFWFLVSSFFFSGPDAAANETTFDPLRIQRILLPADRVPAELKRVKQGTLVQMPRVEFEALVRRAAQQLDALQNPPRLVEAHYQATLAG